MNLEYLLKCLEFADSALVRDKWPIDSEERQSIREAIRRLTPKPAAEGSVEVRMAVAVKGDGTDARIAIISPYFDRTEIGAMEIVGASSHMCIAIIQVPPVAIPIVAGEVVEAKP